MFEPNRAQKSRSGNASHSRAAKLIQACWSAIQLLENRKLDQRTIAGYCSLSDTTLSNWLVGAVDLNQVETLLCLLERIPEPPRSNLLRRMLRLHPSLDSVELAHDPIAVAQLRAIIERPIGFTVISGKRDFPRSFVLNALAQYGTRIGSALGRLTGIDLRSGGVFTPLPGVTYLPNQTERSEIEKYLAACLTDRANLLIVDGVWARIPGSRRTLLKSAQHKSIIVADEISKSDLIPIPGVSAQLVTVEESTSNRLSLSVHNL